MTETRRRRDGAGAPWCSPRRGIIGALVLGLLCVGLLIWTSISSPPRGLGPANAECGAGALSSPWAAGTEGDAVVEREAVAGETDGRVPDGAGEPRTSVLVRVVERGSGKPVSDFWLVLIGSPTAVDISEPREGLSDEQGQVLFENVVWSRARLYPPFTHVADTFAVRPGMLNEVVHEVEPPREFRGEVVDRHGLPISGATVHAVRGSHEGSPLSVREVAVSGAAGGFGFALHASDDLSLFARRAGRAPSRLLRPDLPDLGPQVYLRLILGDTGGRVEGQVLTPAGVAVAGARVSLRGDARFLPQQVAFGTGRGLPPRGIAPLATAVATDAEGRFVFDDVPPGRASVTISAPGWARETDAVDVAPGATSSLRVFMGHGARVAGTVRDSHGRPLGRVTVEAQGVLMATRADGSYVLENVPPGRVYLQASHPEWGRRFSDPELAEGEEMRWDPVFAVGPAIAGLVLNHDGTPAGGIQVVVSAERDYRYGRTDSGGRFRLINFEDREYTVEGLPTGAGTYTFLASGVRPGGPETTFRMPPWPAPDAYLSGRVLGPGGRPVEPLKVWGPERAWVLEDLSADGRFLVGPIRPGEHGFSFETADHLLLQRVVSLEAGAETDIGELRFGEAEPVQVTVREPAGMRGSLRAYLTGGELVPRRWRYYRVEGGRVMLPALSAGTYTLEIQGSHLRTEVLELRVEPGRVLHREIELQLAEPVPVRVLLPAGVLSSILTFTTFDARGQELVSWQRNWEYFWNRPIEYGFRREAVRLVVTGADGTRAEAAIEPGREVSLELR